MTAREVARRIALWSVPVLFIVIAVFDLVTTGAGFLLFGWTGFPIVGAYILTVRPRNGVGHALLAVGWLWLVAGTALLPLDLAGPTLPPDAQALLAAMGGVAGFASFLCLPLIVLLFPSGRISTGLGRVLRVGIIAVLALMALAGFLLPPQTGDGIPTASWQLSVAPDVVEAAGYAVNLAIPLSIVASLVDLILRWRRAEHAERLQYRWFAFGVTVAVSMLATDIVTQIVAPDLNDALDSSSWFLLALVNAIPVTIGIAVTRHGLYAIDRVVSRTVSYAIVTAIAVAVYAVIVTSVTWMLPGAPALAVAAAALAAAALFLPVLRAVQRRLDRRFDRARYDAARVVDAFGESLRTEVDTAATASDLVRAAERTLQPTAVGVWTVTR